MPPMTINKPIQLSLNSKLVTYEKSTGKIKNVGSFRQFLTRAVSAISSKYYNKRVNDAARKAIDNYFTAYASTMSTPAFAHRLVAVSKRVKAEVLYKNNTVDADAIKSAINQVAHQIKDEKFAEIKSLVERRRVQRAILFSQDNFVMDRTLSETLADTQAILNPSPRAAASIRQRSAELRHKVADYLNYLDLEIDVLEKLLSDLQHASALRKVIETARRVYDQDKTAQINAEMKNTAVTFMDTVRHCKKLLKELEIQKQFMEIHRHDDSLEVGRLSTSAKLALWKQGLRLNKVVKLGEAMPYLDKAINDLKQRLQLLGTYRNSYVIRTYFPLAQRQHTPRH